jgi:hypothetical protein
MSILHLGDKLGKQPPGMRSWALYLSRWKSEVNILKPGSGNQKANKKAAVEYITSNIFEVESMDVATGIFTTTDGVSYQVSAYAETAGAFVSTPTVETSRNSIYTSGLPALMFRQLKNDKRSILYEVDPPKLYVKPNSSTAEWSDISRVATRKWICTSEEIRLIERSVRKS